MKIIKSFDRIKKQMDSRQPLWVCLDHNAIGGMAIGWMGRLAENNMIALPSEKDLKNHEFMIVALDAKRLQK